MIHGLDWAAAAAFGLLLVLVLARTAVAELGTVERPTLRRFDFGAGAAVVALVAVLAARVLAQL
ncbi:hypothetical protein [Amycolatopsis saalfeldensis]|uniref:Uncharacterized protein n=1 Tax=Amycolatopsis saalfeldensis TaxID=394193 RepID=A0A1H8YQF7_9PSEU|nr:hypothetical protein [Amycolatopsis saalfeldensis]SEP54323.1 hypothetical protein SAMN04489732_14311 [Amycolatopsis saalfeldensis]